MINDFRSGHRDDVPDADWADQQAAAEPDPDDTPAVTFPSRAREADSADVADQELEVVFDDED